MTMYAWYLVAANASGASLVRGNADRGDSLRAGDSVVQLDSALCVPKTDQHGGYIAQSVKKDGATAYNRAYVHRRLRRRLGLRGAGARRSATWPLALAGLGATSHTCDTLCAIVPACLGGVVSFADDTALISRQ
jgi:hypothetical protein